MTLWVGHLSKLVAEDDLSDAFGEQGQVNTIDLIPPRGCGFVCMNRRQDAYRVLNKLHKHKIHGKPITVSEHAYFLYTLGRQLIRDILLNLFWKIPPADGLVW